MKISSEWLTEKGKSQIQSIIASCQKAIEMATKDGITIPNSVDDDSFASLPQGIKEALVYKQFLTNFLQSTKTNEFVNVNILGGAKIEKNDKYNSISNLFSKLNIFSKQNENLAVKWHKNLDSFLPSGQDKYSIGLGIDISKNFKTFLDDNAEQDLLSMLTTLGWPTKSAIKTLAGNIGEKGKKFSNSTLSKYETKQLEYLDLVEAIENSAKTIDDEIEFKKQELQDIKAKCEELKANNPSHEQELQEIINNIDENSTKVLNDIANRIKEVSQSLKSTTTIYGLKDIKAVIDARIEMMATYITENFTDKYENINEQLSSPNIKASKIIEEINDKNKKIADLKDNIFKITKDTDDLITNAANLTTEISEIATNIKDIYTEYAEQINDVKDDSVVSIKSQIDKNTDSRNKAQKTLEETESVYQNLSKNIISLNEAEEEIKSTINKLSNNLNKKQGFFKNALSWLFTPVKVAAKVAANILIAASRPFINSKPDYYSLKSSSTLEKEETIRNIKANEIKLKECIKINKVLCKELQQVNEKKIAIENNLMKIDAEDEDNLSKLENLNKAAEGQFAKAVILNDKAENLLVQASSLETYTVNQMQPEVVEQPGILSTVTNFFSYMGSFVGFGSGTSSTPSLTSSAPSSLASSSSSMDSSYYSHSSENESTASLSSSNSEYFSAESEEILSQSISNDELPQSDKAPEESSYTERKRQNVKFSSEKTSNSEITSKKPSPKFDQKK